MSRDDLLRRALLAATDDEATDLLEQADDDRHEERARELLALLASEGGTKRHMWLLSRLDGLVEDDDALRSEICLAEAHLRRTHTDLQEALDVAGRALLHDPGNEAAFELVRELVSESADLIVDDVIEGLEDAGGEAHREAARRVRDLEDEHMAGAPSDRPPVRARREAYNLLSFVRAMREQGRAGVAAVHYHAAFRDHVSRDEAEAAVAQDPVPLPAGFAFADEAPPLHAWFSELATCIRGGHLAEAVDLARVFGGHAPDEARAFVETVDPANPPAPPAAEPAWMEEARVQMRAGQLMAAINLARLHGGYGLKEAKELVEGLL